MKFVFKIGIPGSAFRVWRLAFDVPGTEVLEVPSSRFIISGFEFRVSGLTFGIGG